MPYSSFKLKQIHWTVTVITINARVINWGNTVGSIHFFLKNKTVTSIISPYKHQIEMDTFDTLMGELMKGYLSSWEGDGRRSGTAAATASAFQFPFVSLASRSVIVKWNSWARHETDKFFFFNYVCEGKDQWGSGRHLISNPLMQHGVGKRPPVEKDLQLFVANSL